MKDCHHVKQMKLATDRLFLNRLIWNSLTPLLLLSVQYADIDYCVEDNVCSQKTPRSYYCICQSGFLLVNDPQ